MSTAASLDPLRATDAVATAYTRYLRSSLRSNDQRLNSAIEEAFKRVRTPWLKGPFLEASPNYQHGVTLKDLVREGVLSPRWLESNGAFSIHRPLYRHQETAIRKLVTERRNVVVATGTGSGKTESFLLPIINQIFREQEQGSLRSGVRALLLYPMNALANDQLKRLRDMLQDFPEVTFGRYTGDTPETRADGIEKAKNSGVKLILPNEMFGRQEMRERPPHLLLTNYAMLEYLLIRPDDSPLFAVCGDNEWRFIVLDEVHSYEGTMGLEIGMLLRRLLDRVGRGPGKTQAIATSATAGGPGDRKQIAKFASDLFGLPFEWDDDDPARQDVIVASREAPRLPAPGPRIDLEEAVRTGNSDALLADPRVQDLLTSLWEDRLTLEEAAAKLGDAAPFKLTASVVRALSSLRDPEKGLPLLRVKYHTFVRSPDGMFVCLRDHDGGPRVFLESARHCDVCGPAAMVIEVATCRRCGQWHLRGTVSGDERSGRLQAALNLPDSSRDVLFLGPRVAEEPVDEPEEPGELVELVLQGEKQDEKQLFLCFSCLRAASSGDCSCPNPRPTPMTVAARTESGAVRCVNCKAPSSQRGPRRLSLGSDAPPAVIASALFDALPRGEERPRFLAFSDSRQDAAFFAAYLERTYNRTARRRVIYQVLRETWEATGGEGLRLDNLSSRLASAMDRAGFFTSDTSALRRKDLAVEWLIAELTAMDERQSLAGVGLTELRLVRPGKWEPPRPLLSPPWSLTPEEAWALLEELLKTLLAAQVVSMPHGVDVSSEIFQPRNKRYAVRQDGPARTAELEILSWVPQHPAINRRLDYLVRIHQAKNPTASVDESKATARALLQNIWRYLSDQDSPFRSILQPSNEPSHGIVYRLNPNSWEFRPPRALLQCSSCGTIEPEAVAGVCPSFRCSGRLEPVSELTLDHYRALYQEPPLGPMYAEEHTAQWSTEKASEIQGDFISKNGRVNVLSCSTTFELGVDVGELEVVLLRNVPPSAANYVQRAGRAGRRASSAALIVTFAQLRPHDRQVFASALDYVAGKVPAPQIPSGNVPIVRRHVHSVALSRFLRKTYGKSAQWPRVVEEFFGDGAGSPCEEFRRYLLARDPGLRDELLRVVPSELHEELGLQDWAWAAALADQDPFQSPLARVEREKIADMQQYRRLMDEAAANHRFQQADRYQKVLNTISRAELLGTLASANVLPKYGFPVDVVPLKTAHVSAEVARDIELQRDLRVAVSEYAPGSGVVAAKQFWKSAGLQLLPNRQLPDRKYAVCEDCNRIYLDSGATGSCSQCDGPTRASTFVDPVFGFVAAPPPRKGLGEERPPRIFASRMLFYDFGPQQARTCVLGSPSAPLVLGRFTRQGSLAVVNNAYGRGFRLCHTCGFATAGAAAPAREGKGSHKNPVTGQQCSQTLARVDLGHLFTSDIAEFKFVNPGLEIGPAVPSVLSALREGARRFLKASDDDLGGLTYLEAGQPVFVLYDNVPGGAGLARSAFEQFERVMEEARKVCSCSACGEHSSCYGCLRTYQNQHQHDQLDRTIAQEVITSALERAGSAAAAAS
jgi:ATP-dependent helicase YprA (DUF1998 family)